MEHMLESCCPNPEHKWLAGLHRTLGAQPSVACTACAFMCTCDEMEGQAGVNINVGYVEGQHRVSRRRAPNEGLSGVRT